MRFYQFHPGDYLRDTAHLTPLEDCIYRRALDWLYSNEKPLPLDSVQAARLLRVAGQQEAVGAILAEFLTQTPEGWISNRANAQIEQYRKMQQGGAEGAERRWAKAKKGEEGFVPAEQSPSDSVGHDQPKQDQLPEEMGGVLGEEIGGALRGRMLTSNQKPVTSNQNKKHTRPAKPSAFVSVDRLVEMGVDLQAATDWLAIRKEKRLPLTVTALDKTIEEATKAGLTLPVVVKIAAGEGWAGFKASWMDRLSESSRSFIATHTDRSWRQGLTEPQGFIEKHTDRSWAEGL